MRMFWTCPAFLGATLLTAAVVGGVVGCEPPPANEINNPRLYHVMAVYDGPDGAETFVGKAAELRCLRFSCGAGDDRHEHWQWERDAEPEDCRCAGTYVLEARDGFQLAFLGRNEMGPGTHYSSQTDALAVRFRGQPGEGVAHVARLRRLEFAFGNYAMDVSGGFEVDAGPHRFRRGIFYSVEAE